MKIRLLTLALVVLTTISPSEESRSSSNQGRGVSGWKILSGPVSPVNLTGPKRYAAVVDPSLRRAMETLSARNGHAVQYRFSGNQSHPVQVRGFRSRRYNGSAETQARAFLREHQDLVGTSGSEGELLLRSIRESATGNHVRFQSGHEGIPVHGSFVSVHLNHSGEVVMVNNISPARQPGDFARRVERMQAAGITDQEAISRAMSAVGVRSLRLPPEAVRVVVAAPDQARADSVFSAAWKIQLAAADPLGDWQIVVDGETGAVIEEQNLMRFANGRGRVFEPNPVVSNRDPLLRDNNDSDAAIPAQSYFTRDLPDLDDSGTLTGPYANTSLTANRAVQPNLIFEYTRSDPRFEEVNAYYHVDSMQRYIQSLGFSSLVRRSVPMNVHAQMDADDRSLGDASYYSPFDGGLHFSDGGVDNAEDGEIVAHEYAHAMIYDQIPNVGTGGETAALLEGFADFWAASYFSAVSQGHQDTCIADWDAVEYSPEFPNCRTRVDRQRHYPEDLENEPHRDGEIWSSTLWQIYQVLGRELTNLLVLESNYLLSPAADFREAANAVLEVDTALYGGMHVPFLRQTFQGRGILSSQDNASVPLFSDRPKTGSIASGAGTGGTFAPVQYAIVISSSVASVRFDLDTDDPVDIDLFVRRNDAVAVGGDGVIVADARAQSALGTEVIVLSDKSSPILRPGVYYVAIVNFSTSAASYDISATAVQANPVDGEFPQSGELVTRTIPASPDGSLQLDPVQFAFVTSTDSALLQVDLVASRPTEIQLYGRFGGKVLQSSSGGIVADLVGESLGGEEHFLITRASVPALRTGEYFFVVGSSEPEPVEFTLRITASTTSLSDKLYFPFYINGREPSLGSSSFFIGLAILNDSDEIAIANFELLGPDGKRITDPVQRLLLVGEQIPVTVNQLFGLPDDHDLRGWVEVSSNVALKGFFLLFDSDFSQVMDGADVSDKTSTTLVFPHVERHGEEFNTVISLCNPGDVAATATYQEFNPAGQKVFSEVIVVPARGSFIGGTTGFDRTSGFIKVTSDAPLAGVEVFGNDQELAALKAVPPGTSNTLFYPHFVINRGYDTLFSLSNPTDLVGQVFLLAFREDGDLLVQITKDMGPNSQVVAPINSLFGIEPDDLVQVGFIKIQSNIVKELVGFAKINFTEGDITSTAAIPASNSPQKTLTFSHVANDVPSGRSGEGSLYTTGITLMSDDTDASYDVIVFDNKGNRLIQSNPFLLPKGKKVSKVLAGSDLTQAFISQAIVAGSGYVKVRSNIPIYGFELFFTRDLTLNSAVPPQ